MGTYLINFIVYSMAMVGLLLVCLMIYKKTMLNTQCTNKNEEFTIENALNLSQRKTLYVIKVGAERFLIASDTERTTFLSKLNNTNTITEDIVKEAFKQDTMPVISQVKDTLYKENQTEKQTLVNVKPIDYSEVMASLRKKPQKKNVKSPVMREMVRKLSQPIFNDEEEIFQK